METTLSKIFDEVERKIAEENKTRAELGAPPLSFARIRLYGQWALLIREEVVGRIDLPATFDIDAVVSGDTTVEQFFIRAASDHRLQYDHLASEIWVPDGAKFETVYSGQYFQVSAMDVKSVLVSKAVKAPEKNKVLLQQALKVYGAELRKELDKHGVDLSKFNDRDHGHER